MNSWSGLRLDSADKNAPWRAECRNRGWFHFFKLRICPDGYHLSQGHLKRVETSRKQWYSFPLEFRLQDDEQVAQTIHGNLKEFLNLTSIAILKAPSGYAYMYMICIFISLYEYMCFCIYFQGNRKTPHPIYIFLFVEWWIQPELR